MHQLHTPSVLLRLTESGITIELRVRLDVASLSVGDMNQSLAVGQVGVVVDDVLFDDSAVVERQHALVPVDVTLAEIVSVTCRSETGSAYSKVAVNVVLNEELFECVAHMGLV